MTLYAFTKAKDAKAYSTDDYMTFNIKTHMKNANWADLESTFYSCRHKTNYRAWQTL